MSLEGRSAVITGGGRGIGAATAEALARSGARVGVAGRNRTEVAEVADRLRAEGHEAFAFGCDVTEPDQVRELAREAEQAMGAVGILVNNAGTASSNTLANTTLDQWNRMMAVNATGTFLCTQAMLPRMVDRGWGRVVNVASVVGLEGARYVTAYAASKHAVVGFTRALAKDIAGTGVAVSAVCPGWVDTPLTRAAVERVVEKTGLSEAEAMDVILSESNQPRLIQTDEVATKIVELCREDAEIANGAVRMIVGDEAVANGQAT